MRLSPSACRDEDEHLNDSCHKKPQFQEWRQPSGVERLRDIGLAEHASQIGFEKTGCYLSAP